MPVKSQHGRRGREKLTVGDCVYHLRYGVGRIVAEWGYFTDTDPEFQKELVVNGSQIYEVEFKDSGRCSVNGDRLIPANLAGEGREVAERISRHRLSV
jgi:hypothetical protein